MAVTVGARKAAAVSYRSNFKRLRGQETIEPQHGLQVVHAHVGILNRCSEFSFVHLGGFVLVPTYFHVVLQRISTPIRVCVSSAFRQHEMMKSRLKVL